MQTYTIRMSRKSQTTFQGICLADVTAHNHDNSIRRRFRLYQLADGFVAERVDDPDTIDVRYWGANCASTMDIYDFFGNEPLANYLYGRLALVVPGLRSQLPEESA